MADANKTKLAWAPETTFNTDPGNGATFTEVRMKSESFKADLSVASSDEIRSYRDIPSLNLTDRAVSGGIDANLSYDSFDAFFVSALGSSGWSTSNSFFASGGGNVVVDQSEKKYTHASGWANNATAGGWVYLAGFANADSNGFKKVVSCSSTVLVVEEAIGADETASSGHSGLNLSYIKNTDPSGSTPDSFTFQRSYTDLSSKCARYTGCVFNGFSIEAGTNATIGINFDIMGAVEVSSSSVHTVDTAANTNTEMTSQDHVQEIRENAVAYSATGFSLNVTNNMRSQYKLGTLGADAIKMGDFEVTGSIQAYFADSTTYDKFLNQTQTSLSLIVSDETTTQGNAYIIDLPAVKFTDGQRVAGGRNQDIIADLSFQAFYDSTASELCSMKIVKVPSA